MDPPAPRTNYPTPPAIDPTLRRSARTKKPVKKYSQDTTPQPSGSKPPKKRISHRRPKKNPTAKTTRHKQTTSPLPQPLLKDITKQKSFVYEILAAPAGVGKGQPLKLLFNRVDDSKPKLKDRRFRSHVVVYLGADKVLLSENFEGKNMAGKLEFLDKPIIESESKSLWDKMDEEFDELEMDAELDALVSDGE